jgi:hypothetical protein
MGFVLLDLCGCFVDRCLSLCTFSFWPLCCLFFYIRILITSLWYLQTLLIFITTLVSVIGIGYIGRCQNNNYTSRHDGPWYIHDGPWHIHDGPCHIHDGPWHFLEYCCLDITGILVQVIQ